MVYLVLFIIACMILGFLASIRDEISKTNRKLEKVLNHLQIDNPLEDYVIPEGLAVYREPDEQSEVLSRIPGSWKVTFGETRNGWIAVQVRTDAPLSVLNLRGWVKVSDLSKST